MSYLVCLLLLFFESGNGVDLGSLDLGTISIGSQNYRRHIDVNNYRPLPQTNPSPWFIPPVKNPTKNFTGTDGDPKV